MRSFALVALWVMASLGAISVAWAGVGVVSNEVIAPPAATFAPLAADAVPIDEDSGSPDDQGAEAASPLADTGTTDSSSTTTSSTTITTTTITATTGAESPPPSTTQQPGSGGDTSVNGQQTTSTTAPPASTSTVPTTTSTTVATTTSTTVPTTNTDPPAPAETLTFPLVGGTAAISFSSSEVKLLWATSNPGFDLTIEPQSPGLKIEFRSDSHRSRVDAWWEGGPAHEIEERSN